MGREVDVGRLEGEEMRSRRAGKIRCTGNAECHTELTDDENDIKSSLVRINSMLMHVWSCRPCMVNHVDFAAGKMVPCPTARGTYRL